MAASLLKFRGLADELARVHTVVNPDDENMEVHVCKHGDSYAWELHRPGKFNPVKFSVPIYGSEEAARSAGHEAKRLLFVKREKRRRKFGL
jgi:hypothetical protein